MVYLYLYKNQGTARNTLIWLYFLEELSGQNIPHRPAYAAGSAGYITLGAVVSNPNDPIREALVLFLYDVYRRNVPSENGLVRGDVLVSEVRKRTGMERQALAANLEYLVGSGYVEHKLQPIFHHGQVVPGMGKHYYRITNSGVDSVEQTSTYMKTSSASSITVNTQNGITIIGDNNTVSVGQIDDVIVLLKELNTLVKNSKSLADSQKEDVSADIQTMEVQLKKSKPSREILQTAWKGIEMAVTGSEFTALATKLADLVGSLA